MSNPKPPNETPRDSRKKPRVSKNPLPTLTPPEPDGETLARIWRTVEPQLKLTPEQQAAKRLSAVPLAEPGAATLNRIWQKTAREIREPKRRVVPVAWRYAAASFAVLVLVLVVSVNALSASALPGSPFYGVKRLNESVRKQFAGNDVARAQLELEFAESRLQEARQLVLLNASPALVEQAVADAKSSLDTAAPFVPSDQITSRVQQVDDFVDNLGEPYRGTTRPISATPTAIAPTFPPVASATASRVSPSATVRVTLTVAPTGSTAISTPNVTAQPQPTEPNSSRTPTFFVTPPPTSLNPTLTRAATPTPLLSIPTLPGGVPGASQTPNAPAPRVETPAIPTLGIPTLPIPTVPLPTLPQPTVVIPTLPLPTLPPPTIVIPTVPLPTLPLPTVVIPTLPLPTLPLPTLPLPTVPAPTSPPPTAPKPTVPAPTVPNPTVRAPTAPAPTVPKPTSPLPTLPLPTVPLPTLPLPTVPIPTIPVPTLPLPTLPLPTALP